MISRGCIPLNLVRRKKNWPSFVGTQTTSLPQQDYRGYGIKTPWMLEPGLTFTRTQCEDKDLQLPIKKLLENYFIILNRLSETTWKPEMSEFPLNSQSNSNQRRQLNILILAPEQEFVHFLHHEPHRAVRMTVYKPPNTAQNTSIWNPEVTYSIKSHNTVSQLFFCTSSSSS